MTHSLLLLGAIGWAAWAALSDWRSRRIPNVLTLGAFLVAAAVLVTQQRSLLGGTPASALLGMALAVVLTLPAYAMGKLGAADVKLLAAMGLLTDLPTLGSTFVIGALVGGCMALAVLHGQKVAMLVARWSPRSGLWMDQTLGAPSMSRQLPYGAALALGFTATLWSGAL